MAIQTEFVAGPYTGTYDGEDLGITNDGYTLTHDAKAELIQTSDIYGDSILDGIYRGGNCFIDFEAKTYQAGTITPFWPFGDMGVLMTPTAPVGRQFFYIATSLVLTAVDYTSALDGLGGRHGVGTPHGVNGDQGAINTLTADLAIVPPDANLKLLFTSKLRSVPIRLVLLPFEGVVNNQANCTIWYITT